jgi:hypothetical protein
VLLVKSPVRHPSQTPGRSLSLKRSTALSPGRTNSRQCFRPTSIFAGVMRQKKSVSFFLSCFSIIPPETWTNSFKDIVVLGKTRPACRGPVDTPAGRHHENSARTGAGTDLNLYDQISSRKLGTPNAEPVKSRVSPALYSLVHTVLRHGVGRDRHCPFPS